MTALKPIIIAGGGLAGLTLGLGLRRYGVPVTIWEAGCYPRHRVCGEFISGRGLEVLKRLGLWQSFVQEGATEARTAAFFLGRSASSPWTLPIPALCLSRYSMDFMLARLFEAQGGELRSGQRWDQGYGPGIVRATGRRPTPAEGAWRWFGVKVHARGIPLLADLEIHAWGDRYVGLCRLPHGEINICGLFRRSVGAGGPPPRVKDQLRGPADLALAQRLQDAEFDEGSFCSTAGLGLEPQHAEALDHCAIGDALTMIPPVTGNGMSMAFEAAEAALEPLVAFSRGELSWPVARGNIAQRCDRLFSRRLAWGRWLHRSMFTPLLRGRLGEGVLRCLWVWRVMFEQTR